MRTFQVSDVPFNHKALQATSVAKALRDRLRRDPEASGADSPVVIQTQPSHGLVLAAHTAFKEHYPLTLTPDHIWLTIAQGFAAHVNLNAEALRHKFVKHEGKVALEVFRDLFVKGSASNDWPGVFGEFSDQIAGHIGPKHDLVVCDFSTTTPISRAASEIVLLDAMQSYFEYDVYTRCGIPEITLLGTVADWCNVRAKAAALSEYGLDWWTQELLPVLDQFVRAAEGNVDLNFWQSFYKWHSQSGGDEVTGHVLTFFPYLKDSRTDLATKKNTAMGSARRSRGGPGSDDFPSGLSKAPFTWRHYYADKFAMEFIGGFVGAAQDANGAIRPVLGWAVADAE